MLWLVGRLLSGIVKSTGVRRLRRLSSGEVLEIFSFFGIIRMLPQGLFLSLYGGEGQARPTKECW